MANAALDILPRRTIPSRDADARARLHTAATCAEPSMLARDRIITVDGPIGGLFPAGGVQRGTTVALDGPPGAGSTTIACALAAAATSAGEWAAVVDPDGTFGARAAAETGVALDRCAIVRRVPPDRWATVVAALLDGVALVVATTPPHLSVTDARRLSARARQRSAVLVAHGRWPAPASCSLHARGGQWPGIDDATLLAARDLDVHVDGKEVRGLARVG